MGQLFADHRRYETKDVWFQDRNGKNMTSLEAFIADEQVYIEDDDGNKLAVEIMPDVGYINVYVF